jgi:hypothetical protein
MPLLLLFPAMQSRDEFKIGEQKTRRNIYEYNFFLSLASAPDADGD